MTQTIEILELDLRYENFRMKNPNLERRLLGSIQQRGIEEPLSGIDSSQQHILLDGFKRLRCARSLGLHSLPYDALDEDPALGIVNLLRGSWRRPLTILEQACFIDELHAQHRLSVSEMAQQLGRSKAWVCLRLGLFEELTPAVREKLLAGQFPAYVYLYSIRPFMRINSLPPKRIEEFVLALSGKGLSVRESAWLFQAFVGGSLDLQEQILRGRLELLLRRRASPSGAASGCSELERNVLLDLGRVEKHMRRVTGLGRHEGLKSPAFRAQASLLTARVLQESGPFLKVARQLHARSEQA